MSEITKFEESTILSVRVAFSLTGPQLIPCEVTSGIGITPDFTIEPGAPWLNPLGMKIGKHETGMWGISSARRVKSKNINEHLKHLVDILLPRKRSLCELAKENESFFDVLWKSSYLNAGAGLRLDAECLHGVATLNAGIRFDIYQSQADPRLDPHRASWYA
jgi:hypothetical protein